jgi:hypothetical protein
MDPQTNLQEQRSLVRQINEALDSEQDDVITLLAERLAEKVEALDEWLSKGGFLPKAWTHKDQIGVILPGLDGFATTRRMPALPEVDGEAEAEDVMEG